MISKVKEGTVRLEDYLDQNMAKITSYNLLKTNLTQLEADKRAVATKSTVFKKQRGVWLYGMANKGKTTLAIKSFLEEDYY